MAPSQLEDDVATVALRRWRIRRLVNVNSTSSEICLENHICNIGVTIWMIDANSTSVYNGNCGSGCELASGN